MMGFVMKSCSRGIRWTRRWCVVSLLTGSLVWFRDNPLFSLTVYQVQEAPLGTLQLFDAVVEDYTPDLKKKLVTPTPYVLKVITPARTQLLAFDRKHLTAIWREYILAAALVSPSGQVSVSDRSLLEAGGLGIALGEEEVAGERGGRGTAAAATSGARSGGGSSGAGAAPIPRPDFATSPPLSAPGEAPGSVVSSGGERLSVLGPGYGARPASAVRRPPSAGRPPFFGGYLLKASPGWRTWRRRFIVLDPSSSRLRYFGEGPAPAGLAAVLGEEAGSWSRQEAMSHLKTVSGRRMEALMAHLGSEKGGCDLAGAAVSVEPFDENEGAGALSTSPSFTLIHSSGRVFGFVAPSFEDLQEWVAALDAAIAAADARGPTGPAATAGAALEDPDAVGGSGFASAALRKLGLTRSASAVMRSLTADVHAKRVRVIPLGGPGRLLPAAAPDHPDASWLTWREERAGGWLYKCAPKGSRWARRWFVLRGSTVSYYSGPDQRTLKGSFTLGPFSFVALGAGPAQIAGSPRGARVGVKYPTPHALYLGPPDALDAALLTGWTPPPAPSRLDRIALAVTSGFQAVEPPGYRPYLLAAANATDACAWRDALLAVVNAHRRLNGLTEIATERTGASSAPGTLPEIDASLLAAADAAAERGGGGGDSSDEEEVEEAGSSSSSGDDDDNAGPISPFAGIGVRRRPLHQLPAHHHAPSPGAAGGAAAAAAQSPAAATGPTLHSVGSSFAMVGSNPLAASVHGAESAAAPAAAGAPAASPHDSSESGGHHHGLALPASLTAALRKPVKLLTGNNHAPVLAAASPVVAPAVVAPVPAPAPVAAPAPAPAPVAIATAPLLPVLPPALPAASPRPLTSSLLPAATGTGLPLALPPAGGAGGGFMASLPVARPLSYGLQPGAAPFALGLPVAAAAAPAVNPPA